MIGASLNLILIVALAFSNGANDVSKGIATLAGSGVTRLKTAVAWGACWTVAGGLIAAFVSQGLVQSFSGQGTLLQAPADHAFFGAVVCGALIWVSFATCTGLPVSTTHAITGALLGAGVTAVGHAGIRWATLWDKFLVPLAFSPLIALGLTVAILSAASPFVARLHGYCICLNREMVSLSNQEAGLVIRPEARLIVDSTSACGCAPTVLFRLKALDALHWLSAGGTSFARGLNDAPKIFGLGLGVSLALGVETTVSFLLVAGAMGLGSVLAGIRVTETLAQKITPMSPSEGFVANLMTSGVVIGASCLGLPVSTTHVSSGAIIGLGLARRSQDIHWKTVRELLLAWVVTLPVAGLFGGTIYWLLNNS
ncbi:MAG: inorganic phosphate transporter [Verrucomicrobia bacterium]|nr:inorganic phosphate transporter [Verrucomicrobiota bacterium]